MVSMTCLLSILNAHIHCDKVMFLARCDLSMCSVSHRAAAEWILRNGGSVRFAGFEKPIQDYNILPMGPKTNNYHLEVINARNISLTDNGLEHLGR